MITEAPRSCPGVTRADFLPKSHVLFSRRHCRAIFPADVPLQAVVSDDLGILLGWRVRDSGSSWIFKINVEQTKLNTVTLVPLEVIQKRPCTIHLKIDFIKLDSWNLKKKKIRKEKWPLLGRFYESAGKTTDGQRGYPSPAGGRSANREKELSIPFSNFLF